MASARRITEQIFAKVKEMANNCKNNEFVARKCDVSISTITRVRAADTYEDYVKNSRKANRVTEKAATEKVENPVVVSFDQFKALAKDVDAIKVMMGQMLALSGELLNVWKEG